MKKLTMLMVMLLITLLVAACGAADNTGTGTTTTPADTGGDTGADTGATTDLSVEGLSTLKWEPAQLTAPVGTVNVTMTTDGVLEHNFVWADQPESDFLHVPIGETSAGPESRTFDTAGSYEFYCDIPGHREAGMVGTLTVQ